MIKVPVPEKNVDVKNPIDVTMIDSSGLHVVLTMCIEGQPPLSHIFSFEKAKFSEVIPKLDPGIYDCSFTVQVFKKYEMNNMYDCELLINGKSISHVKGKISAKEPFDVGFANFKIEVTE